MAEAIRAKFKQKPSVDGVVLEVTAPTLFFETQVFDPTNKETWERTLNQTYSDSKGCPKSCGGQIAKVSLTNAQGVRGTYIYCGRNRDCDIIRLREKTTEAPDTITYWLRQQDVAF